MPCRLPPVAGFPFAPIALAACVWSAAAAEIAPPPNAPAEVQWDAKGGTLRLQYRGAAVFEARIVAEDAGGKAVPDVAVKLEPAETRNEKEKAEQRLKFVPATAKEGVTLVLRGTANGNDDLGGTVMNINDRPYSATPEFKQATAYNPNIVIVKLGANDSKPAEWKHKERFKPDLVSLIDHFAGLPSKPKIWLCTPAWVAKHYPAGHDEQVIGGEIVPIVRAVAAEKKLPLIDIHAALKGKPDLYADGVHPNAAGCAVLAQAVFKVIAPAEAAEAARRAAAARAKATQANLEGWEMGPFVKHPEPVLKPNPNSVFKCPIVGKEARWEEMNTYNPAAVVKDGKVYLLYRADGYNKECAWGRVCRIGLAVSEDGVHFNRHPEPVLYPDNDEFKKYEWAGGCEDLHVVEDENGVYYMNYTTHTGKHTGIKDTMSIATSRDLVHWTKHGPAFQKHNPEKVNGSRSGVVVSRRVGDKLIAAKIDGKYWMFYTHGCALAWSEDLINWHSTGKAGWPRGAEAGAIALLRDDGILLMAQTGAGPLGGWCLWQQLHDRADLAEKPQRNNGILKEQKEPFLWPEYEWEIKGMTGYTTVSNALVPFKGKWFLYYGAADTYTGVATSAIAK